MIDAFQILVLTVNIWKILNLKIDRPIFLRPMLMVMIMALQVVLQQYLIRLCNLQLLSLGEEEKTVLWYHMKMEPIVPRKLQGNTSAIL